MGKRFELAQWEIDILKDEARRMSALTAKHNSKMEAEHRRVLDEKNEHERRVLEWTPEECSQWVYEQQKEMECDECIPGREVDRAALRAAEQHLDELLQLLEKGKLDHVRRAIKKELY